MKFLVKLALLALAIFLVAYFFHSLIQVESVWDAVLAALLLSLINAFIKPLVFVLTLPLNILTLGLLTIIINGSTLWLVSALIAGFEIKGFWQAVLAAILISIVSFGLNKVAFEED